MFAHNAVISVASFSFVRVGPLNFAADLYTPLFLNLNFHWARIFADNLLKLPDLVINKNKNKPIT
jgi:hypothetical protein